MDLQDMESGQLTDVFPVDEPTSKDLEAEHLEQQKAEEARLAEEARMARASEQTGRVVQLLRQRLGRNGNSDDIDQVLAAAEPEAVSAAQRIVALEQEQLSSDVAMAGRVVGVATRSRTAAPKSRRRK